MQLLPCPCGRTHIGKRYDKVTHTHYYACSICGRAAPGADTDLLARKSWNTCIKKLGGRKNETNHDN